MEQQQKRYIIAVKSQFRGSVQKDWRAVLESTPGIQVIGSSSARAHVDATPEAIQHVRDEFGDALLIEEESPRYPAG